MKSIRSIIILVLILTPGLYSFAQGTGRGIGGDNTINKVFNVVDFGATGNGTTDDRAAIQAAIDATIEAKGKLIIPAPSNYYRINSTLRFEPKNGTQAFFEVEAQGHWEYCIVYQGPSGQPAAIIDGMKWGSFRNVKIAIGDGISNSVAWDIGTAKGGSTSGFSFYDCVATLNRGENNQGWRLGEIAGQHEDISQILFANCKVEGWNAGEINGVQQHYKGQIGFNITGRNTLALTWMGGGVPFAETAVKLEQGGSLFFFGFQTSHTAIDFHIQWANNVAVYGGRFEVGQKFLKVDYMQAHPMFGVYNAMIEDYKTTDGRLFDVNAPGTIIVDGCAMTSGRHDYDARMFTLIAPSSNGYGSFFLRGGKINAADTIVTSSGFNTTIEQVVKVSSSNWQPIGYLSNSATTQPGRQRGMVTYIGLALIALVIAAYFLLRKRTLVRVIHIASPDSHSKKTTNEIN